VDLVHPPLAHGHSLLQQAAETALPYESCADVGFDLRSSRIVSIVFEVMPAPAKPNTSKIAVVARKKAAS
jgi:hypothetical protein